MFLITYKGWSSYLNIYENNQSFYFTSLKEIILNPIRLLWYGHRHRLAFSPFKSASPATDTVLYHSPYL